MQKDYSKIKLNFLLRFEQSIKLQGTTQKILAKKFGVSTETISRWQSEYYSSLMTNLNPNENKNYR